VHGPWARAQAHGAAVGDPHHVDAVADHPFVGGLLAFITIVVIAVTINGSPTKQGKHELARGTQVVKG
jgi:hypothetical protein